MLQETKNDAVVQARFFNDPAGTFGGRTGADMG